MGLFRRNRDDIETRSYDGPTFSIGDPALAAYFGFGAKSLAGVSVNEGSTLGLSAAYRAVSLISGTVATLPLKTYRKDGEQRLQVASFLDNPGGVLWTPFSWTETVVAHLALHGNAYLLHRYNGAGGIDYLEPLHPSLVTVEADPEHGKLFKVQGADGQTHTFTPADLTHVPGLSVDGLVGLSPVANLRNALGSVIASDEAAARIFGSGLSVSAMVSATEALTPEQAEGALASLKARATGTKNAGGLVFIPAPIKVEPMSMTAEDAQFIESRQFGVAEVARIWGVPVQLLAADGASSWGSGIAELVRGFQKFTLMQYTSRIEAALSRLLPSPRFCEFETKGLVQGTPAEEIQLLVLQVEKGLLTLDEARALMNRPSLPAAPAAPETQEN
jgi:HK97 family phage portal protein